jgi:hypothetical protein
MLKVSNYALTQFILHSPGIGSIVPVMFFITGLVPVIIILILINLGVFKNLVVIRRVLTFITLFFFYWF